MVGAQNKILKIINLTKISGTVREALKAAFEACDNDLAQAALPSGAGFIDK